MHGCWVKKGMVPLRYYNKKHVTIALILAVLIAAVFMLICGRKTVQPVFKEALRIKSTHKYNIADAKRDYMLPSAKPAANEKEGYDIMVIKLDTNGNSQWSRTYGGEYYDWADLIVPLKDGGYLISAKTYSFGEAYEGIYLLKLDAKGNSTDVYRFDTPYDKSLVFQLDSGTLEAGRTYTDADKNYGVNLASIAPDGNYNWIKTFGNNYFEWGYTAVSTKEGHLVTTGQPENTGEQDLEDVFVFERDKEGNYKWNRRFGGNKYDRGYSISAIREGGYIVSGLSCSYGNGYDDAYLIKLDANCNSVWARTYGGDSHDRAYSSEETTDKGFITAGSSMSYNKKGNFEMYVFKTDADGNTQWMRTYGGKGDFAAYSVAVTKDGGYVAAGAAGR